MTASAIKSYGRTEQHEKYAEIQNAFWRDTEISHADKVAMRLANLKAAEQGVPPFFDVVCCPN
jgi:hypothetical protein